MAGSAVGREEGTDWSEVLKGQPSYESPGPYLSFGCQVPSKEELPFLFCLCFFGICDTHGPSQG